MAKKLFFGGSYWDLWLFLIGLIFFPTCLFTLGYLLPPVDTDKLVMWVCIFAVTGSLFALRFALIARTRRWLAATDTGFVVETAWGKRTITDDAVADLGIVEQSVSAGGERAGQRVVTLDILADGGYDHLKFEQFHSAGKPDALGAALYRALAVLVDHWAKRLDAGQTLNGDGWSLRRDGLEVNRAGTARWYSLYELDSVERVYEEVWVWGGGRSEPILKVHGTAPFGTLLFHLLTNLRGGVTPAESMRADGPATSRKARADEAPVPARAVASEADGTADPDFGRLLFSRDEIAEPAVYRRRLATAIVSFVLGSALWVLAILSGTDHQGPAVFGGLITMGALTAAVLIWTNQRTALRCYTHGVVYKTWRGTITLRYRDVGSFTYAATQVFVEGVGYSRTKFKMVFEPLESGIGPPIRYHNDFVFTDTRLEDLRDFISRQIAGHMLARLQRGSNVGWTPQLMFTPTGLQVQRSGKAGAVAPRIVPYDQLGTHKIEEGIFYLTTDDGDEPPVVDPVSHRNFFPGYYLYLLLTNRGNAERDEPAPLPPEL